MSLINDALRDLDSRSEKVTSKKNDSRFVAQTVQGGRRYWWVLVGVLALLVLSVASRGWLTVQIDASSSFLSGIKTSSEPEITVVSVQMPVVEPLLTEELLEPAQGSFSVSHTDTALTEAKAAEHETPDKDDIRQEAIRALVALGEEAFVNDRLTVPARDNALYYYNQILTLDELSAEGKAGKEKIIQRYQALLTEAWENRDNVRLEYLLSRVEASGLALARIARFQRGLEGLETKAVTQREVSASELSNTELNPALVTSVSIQKTLSTRDEAVADREREQYQRGNRRSAKSTLMAFIQEVPRAQKSRLVLFDIYMEEGAHQSAQGLVDSARLRTVVMTYLQARLLLAENNFSGAQLLLETHSFAVLHDRYKRGTLDSVLFEQYNSLQAALFQRQKAHAMAAEKYQFLLGLNHQNGNYWLGFAVSVDALQQRENALAAYQQVLAMGELKPEVEAYVQSRITLLSKRSVQPEIAGASVNP